MSRESLLKRGTGEQKGCPAEKKKKFLQGLFFSFWMWYNSNEANICSKIPARRAETMSEKVYIAIDLKSFYASVECVERGLDPLKTNLVVADISRTEKTICLASVPLP